MFDEKETMDLIILSKDKSEVHAHKNDIAPERRYPSSSAELIFSRQV